MEAYRNACDLLESLQLSPTDIPDLDPDPGDFGVLVPRGFAALMRPGDPTDPLLRQVLPLRLERYEQPGFLKDPLGEADADQGSGLLQKYHGRALMMVTSACGIHCRYCFRRHFDYAELGASTERWGTAIDRVAADDSLHELILSGGDPLMLGDDQLAELVARLSALPHLRRLRIHTRLPVVLPARITPRLCAALTSSRLTTIVVVHANHPRELVAPVAEGLAKLQRTGIRLFNQSVLLRDVNADAQVLSELSERLFECGVAPYYIHQLDRVLGAAHFQVGDEPASDLMKALRGRLSGFLVPRLVREIPGAASKIPAG